MNNIVFNNDWIKNFLYKSSKENKTLFLLSDFQISMLSSDIHPPTDEFLESILFYYFLPHTLQLTRVKNNFKTLIDNIFSNMSVPTVIFGNPTAFRFGHL